MPGGSLTSKPTWSNTPGCSTTSAFFVFRGAAATARGESMDQSNRTMGQRIAQAARTFEQRRTRHGRKWVTVFLNEDTMVITLHGSLTSAEKALAKSPAGAAQVREFHQQLFANASDS